MQTKYIFKGSHRALPLNLRKSKKGENFKWSYDFKFLDAAYIHDNGDQDDWNKLIGLTGNYWNRTKNAVMVGWAFNPKMGVFDLNFYIHRDGSTEKGETLFSVSVNEMFIVVLEQIGEDVYISLSTESGYELQKFKMSDFSCESWYLIDGWFGGNRVAPRTLKYEQIKRK